VKVVTHFAEGRLVDQVNEGPHRESDQDQTENVWNPRVFKDRRQQVGQEDKCANESDSSGNKHRRKQPELLYPNAWRAELPDEVALFNRRNSEHRLFQGPIPEAKLIR
jgi:hypothetical protein